LLSDYQGTQHVHVLIPQWYTWLTFQWLMTIFEPMLFRQLVLKYHSLKRVSQPDFHHPFYRLLPKFDVRGQLGMIHFPTLKCFRHRTLLWDSSCQLV
jgi:hypothetical protein